MLRAGKDARVLDDVQLLVEATTRVDVVVVPCAGDAVIARHCAALVEMLLSRQLVASGGGGRGEVGDEGVGLDAVLVEVDGWGDGGQGLVDEEEPLHWGQPPLYQCRSSASGAGGRVLAWVDGCSDGALRLRAALDSRSSCASLRAGPVCASTRRGASREAQDGNEGGVGGRAWEDGWRPLLSSEGGSQGAPPFSAESVRVGESGLGSMARFSYELASVHADPLELRTVMAIRQAQKMGMSAAEVGPLTVAVLAELLEASSVINVALSSLSALPQPLTVAVLAELLDMIWHGCWIGHGCWRGHVMHTYRLLEFVR